ncbi:MAG: hypothetical protein HQ541_05970 [Mariniphaga sp.]|nr:hypothetical protein [Mariniphaga sp.]
MGKIIRILSIACILWYIGDYTVLAQAGKSKSHNISIAISEVALLDLESISSSAISINPISPTEAGNALDFSMATNNQIWINYSSITGLTEPQRKVSVYVDGAIPDGVVLNVIASSYSGNGNGKTGISTGKVKLSGQVRNIITNIGSCYTGDGINNGHLLTYSLELDKSNSGYGNLNFDESTTISVTYTLSDNN